MDRKKHQPLIIGKGRLAKHICHYLNLKNTESFKWNRSLSDEQLEKSISQCSIIYLAISDSSLYSFFKEKLQPILLKHNSQQAVVHFSGALHLPPMIAAHPLMSFPKELYDLSFYEKIHFSLTGSQNLKEIFPSFENSFSILPAEEKPLYHALCVMGGNFPQMLWNFTEAQLEQLKIPAAAIENYFSAILENYKNLKQHAITGPLVRKDRETMQKNMSALETFLPWKKVYQSFTEVNR